MNTIIVGGGLTGLILTHQLQRAGDKVTLIEAREHLGGSHRRPGFNFFSASNDNMTLLEMVRSHSPLPLNFEIKEHRPEIFDEARWRDFLGFGETSFQSVSELAFLSHTHETVLSPGPDQLVRALIEQLPIAATVKTEVTEIKFLENGCEVIVNGEKSIKGDRVIFTGAPESLNTLIQGETLPAKHRTRLAKFNKWTAVVLELDAAIEPENHNGILLFQYSGKDFEPVFGRLDGATSRWMTLVHAERAEEYEFAGQCIRHIKRQLKRAWPNLFENNPAERICVNYNAFGQNSLKTKSTWQFPELPALFMANHTLATQPGFMGALEAAYSVESLLMGNLETVGATDVVSN